MSEKLVGVPEEQNPARAIYGTILVMAVIAALAHDESITSAELIAGVAATTIVFWIAHVYAEVLGNRLHEDNPMNWANAWSAIQHEWPIVQAAVPLVLALGLGVVGILDTDSAVNVAIGVGILELFLWGLTVGRKLGLSLTATIAAGVVNGALGVAIAGLKVLVH
ncbi:MAG TPA: hypothetical protein VH834_06335 [Solirubrobacteraceae bacterium]|jgi:hypothetical protein